MIQIAGVKVWVLNRVLQSDSLHCGDFSRQEDRHLMVAEIPPMAPDILIVESTYGVQIHEPRREREKRFTTFVSDVVKRYDHFCILKIQRGGRCLIPVFALGRAQELLLILDEHWNQHPDLHNIPVYYAKYSCQEMHDSLPNLH